MKNIHNLSENYYKITLTDVYEKKLKYYYEEFEKEKLKLKKKSDDNKKKEQEINFLVLLARVCFKCAFIEEILGKYYEAIWFYFYFCFFNT
jgi:hypothetical protein